MIPSLDELRKSVHTKLNDLRSIEGLLGGDFEDVWTDRKSVV